MDELNFCPLTKSICRLDCALRNDDIFEPCDIVKAAVMIGHINTRLEQIDESLPTNPQKSK